MARKIGRYALAVLIMALAGWMIGLGAALASTLLGEGPREGWDMTAGYIWHILTCNGCAEHF